MKTLYCVFCKARNDHLIILHYKKGRYPKCPECKMLAWAEYKKT